MKYTELNVIKHTQKSHTALAAVDGYDEPVVIKKIYLNDRVKDASANINLYKQLQSVSNEHITKIYSAKFDEDCIFVVEEYIDGLTLDEYIKKNNCNENEIINLILQLCDGLKTLHGASPAIIHRDLKPSNILVTNKGLLKIIDFDASRNYKKDTTHDTVIMGTLEYASPEQYGFSQTDARSDIYSVGAIMYQLFFHETLPQNNTGIITAKNINKNSEKNTIKYESAIRKIIKRCTMFDPAKRYTDICQLENELKHFKSKRFLKNIGRITAAACVVLIVALGLNTAIKSKTAQIPSPVSTTTASKENNSSDKKKQPIYIDFYNSSSKKYEISLLYFLKSDCKSTPIQVKTDMSKGLHASSVSIQSVNSYRDEFIDKKYWSEENDGTVVISDDYLKTLSSDATYKLMINYTKFIISLNICVIDKTTDIKDTIGQSTLKSMPGSCYFYTSTPADINTRLVNCFDRKILSIKDYNAGKDIPKKYWHIDYESYSLTISKEYLKKYKNGNDLNLEIRYTKNKKVPVNDAVPLLIFVREHPYIEPKFSQKKFTVNKKNGNDLKIGITWNDAKDHLQYISNKDGKKIPDKYIKLKNDAIIISKQFFASQKIGTYTYIFEFGDYAYLLEFTIK